ncbi:nicotinic acid mononucleotide adenyltransferase [uncultured Nonlabens sp.]|uniref:toxin-antitoxin system YwqK family antitoxin n=1 Tax=uncultured Nonlabens sp. TaxID=859306 RepID=UPI00261FD32D|nr:nicotinic acid mononucleotide adenyltransferase [uncultured Nonlabens sp.]
MKKLIIFAVMMVGVFATAQEVKPTFEKMEDGVVKATYFHENGTVAQTGTFLNDKRHGEWISYSADGLKTAKAEYKNDRKAGKWFFWKGDQLTEVDYSENAIIAVNTWVSKEPVATNKP